jgi:hypothetical protein
MTFEPANDQPSENAAPVMSRRGFGGFVAGLATGGAFGALATKKTLEPTPSQSNQFTYVFYSDGFKSLFQLIAEQDIDHLLLHTSGISHQTEIGLELLDKILDDLDRRDRDNYVKNHVLAYLNSSFLEDMKDRLGSRPALKPALQHPAFNAYFNNIAEHIKDRFEAHCTQSGQVR